VFIARRCAATSDSLLACHDAVEDDSSHGGQRGVLVQHRRHAPLLGDGVAASAVDAGDLRHLRADSAEIPHHEPVAPEPGASPLLCLYAQACACARAIQSTPEAHALERRCSKAARQTQTILKSPTGPKGGMVSSETRLSNQVRAHHRCRCRVHSATQVPVIQNYTSSPHVQSTRPSTFHYPTRQHALTAW
jgi:hypothetical protein